MGREATITQEQVNAAADGLRAAGQRPTVRAVRERLGSGTQVTVMRMLAVWQGGQVKPADTPLTLSAGLQRALVDFVGQAVAEGKTALATELAELQQVKEDLAIESERQAATIERLESDLEESRRDRDALTGRALQLEEDLAAAREDADTERAAAEGARTELAKAQLRLEAMPRLEADLAAVRADLDRERAGRVAAEQAAAVASARLEGESAARARLDAELQALAKREAAATARGGELADQLAGERAGRQAAEVKRDDLAEQLTEHRQALDLARKQLEVRQAEAAELRGKLAALSPAGEAAPVAPGKKR